MDDYDDRWQQVWIRRCRGETWTAIAEDLEVHRNTVMRWYEKWCAIERLRAEDPEQERSFLLSRFEQMAMASLTAFDTALQEPDVKWVSDPRPAHMANVIKALSMVARLQGFDVKRQININHHQGESEVTIKVGGQTMVRRRVKRDQGVLNGQAIEVSSSQVDGSGDGPGDEVAEGQG
jgi:hypothetical protein